MTEPMSVERLAELRSAAEAAVASAARAPSGVTPGHIQSFDPDDILELLAEIDRATAERDRAYSDALSRAATASANGLTGYALLALRPTIVAAGIADA